MKKIIKIIIVLFIFLSMFSVNSIVASSTQSVINGIYEIEWAQNNNKVLDISAASNGTGANVQIWDKCNGKQQRF